MRAYDIQMPDRPVDRADPRDRGWCFGLPPGIGPDHWPLDPNNGYPLLHGFTLLLPADYCCHGPDVVALSFFATAPDMNDGAAVCDERIRAAFDLAAAEPAEPELAAFRRAERNRHPRLHRMSDVLGCSYAVILLEAREYAGALCPPPLVPTDGIRGALRRPEWLSPGDRAGYFVFNETMTGRGREIMCPPFSEDPSFNRAIRWSPRAVDPNAGLAPQERWVTPASGYVPEWIEVDGQPVVSERPWTSGHSPNHIGGTMYPVQNIPEGFSPYYVEVDDGFGGFNFGCCGKGQLDFKTMKFDWADG